jgi:hypothetical protein
MPAIERAQAAADLDPFDVRQHPVEDDEVGLEAGDGVQRLPPGLRLLDVVGLVAQRGRDRVDDRRLVVDDQDLVLAHALIVARVPVNQLRIPGGPTSARRPARRPQGTVGTWPASSCASRSALSPASCCAFSFGWNVPLGAALLVLVVDELWALLAPAPNDVAPATRARRTPLRIVFIGLTSLPFRAKRRGLRGHCDERKKRLRGTLRLFTARPQPVPTRGWFAAPKRPAKERQ